MKALLKNYHQSPRKVRLVADLIRGKSVPAARAALLYLPKKSSPAISKLLDSAVANARQTGAEPANLFVKKITVDKGLVMRRARPFARGRSGSLRKAMSIVFIELGTSVGPAKATKPARAKKVKAKKETT
jgi:large subunit ribosomal protein L22